MEPGFIVAAAILQQADGVALHPLRPGDAGEQLVGHQPGEGLRAVLHQVRMAAGPGVQQAGASERVKGTADPAVPPFETHGGDDYLDRVVVPTFPARTGAG